MNLPDYVLGDLVPLAFVGVFIALVVLPAVTFGIARKWSAQQPDATTAILGGAVIVTVTGILAAAFLALIVIGWIPPIDQLMHASAPPR